MHDGELDRNQFVPTCSTAWSIEMSGLKAERAELQEQVEHYKVCFAEATKKHQEFCRTLKTLLDPVAPKDTSIFNQIRYLKSQARAAGKTP